MSDSRARPFTLLGMYCATVAMVAVAVGSMVLSGWAFHIDVLKSGLPGLIAIKANTGLELALAGVSLWLLLPGESRTRRGHVARVLALLVTLLGAATVGEYLFGVALRLDQLWITEPTGTAATASPGRVAPMSSTAFLALGLALLLLDWKTRRGHRPALVLSLWTALVAMTVIIGYLYHATALYRIVLDTPMGLQTAILLLLLSGAVFFARPRTGLASDLTSEASGSVMARRLLPAVLCVPVVLGWMRLQGQQARLYGTEFGTALFATADIVVFAVLVWLSARHMNAEHHQRSQAEAATRALNADLERRVADRTKTLEQQAAVLTEQAALLDLAQDAIVVRDADHRCVFWNRGAEVMYGWLSHEALGRNTRELLDAELSEPLEPIEAELVRQGRWQGEVIHHTRAGARLIVASRWAVQRDADGAPVRILTIDTDITDRKQAEFKLEDAIGKLQSLTERLSLATAVAKVGVWEWDLATHALTWDATMFAIYGLPPIVPMPYDRWAAAVCPEDLPGVEATLQRAIDTRSEGSATFRITMTDGSLRHVSAVERVVLDERANVSRVVGVHMDVTERTKAEAALEQSRNDQLRFKDEFLSHVSHELRSPLTAIKQFTTILLSGLAGELNSEQREYQQIVLKNIRQLQSLIDELLEVTRLETGKLGVELERVSVSAAVTDTFNTLQVTARAKGVTLSCDLPPDLPSVHADPARLRQILIILLDNAIKFTADGGAVHVQARLLPQDREFVVLAVSDTGCGISPAISERIFERLYQVAEPAQAGRKGLGLGLYICKELVTRQGGHIWVESTPQTGSTFSLTLPVFSLNTVIAPLLRNAKWPAESVALVMVELVGRGAASSLESHEEWSHEVRSLVQRCLLPDLDVLLPKMSSSEEGERLFIVAFANADGTSVLVNRIREQFERLPVLKRTGLTLLVSYRMLEPVPPDVGASVDHIVTRMATNLEESIKNQITAEAVHHE